MATTPRAAAPAVGQNNAVFTIFNRLPTELRLQIWEMALPDARLIDMLPLEDPEDFLRSLESESEELSNTGSPNNTTVQHGLGMLGACKESREVVFESFRILSPDRHHIPKPLYFKTAEDLFLFNTISGLRFYTNPQNLETGYRMIRRVAIYVDIWTFGDGNQLESPETLRDMRRAIWAGIKILEGVRECGIVFGEQDQPSRHAAEMMFVQQLNAGATGRGSIFRAMEPGEVWSVGPVIERNWGWRRSSAAAVAGQT